MYWESKFRNAGNPESFPKWDKQTNKKTKQLFSSLQELLGVWVCFQSGESFMAENFAIQSVVMRQHCLEAC